MDTTQLLVAVDRGLVDPNVAIFRFHRGRTLTNAVLYGAVAIALIVFAIVIAPHVNLQAGGVVYGAAFVFAALVALALFRTLRLAQSLLYPDNVLVVTPLGVVRRWRGRVSGWSFAEFPDLNFVRANHRVESIYLNRTGKQFDQPLVDDGSFGTMEEILEALRARRSGNAPAGWPAAQASQGR